MEPQGPGADGISPPAEITEQPKKPGTISPDILSALAISQQDLDSHKEVLNQQLLEKINANGKSYYENFDGQDINTIQLISDADVKQLFGPNAYGDNLAIEKTGVGEYKRSDLPRDLYKAWQKRENHLRESYGKREQPYPEDDTYYKDNTRAFLEGFGTGALEANDWDTAINAFDLTTAGGVIQNEAAISKMKELPIEDKIKIATKLQEKTTAREQSGIPAGALAPIQKAS